jgi:hypothetical protein
MAWKHELQTLKPGKAWTDSTGRLHPAVWMRYSAETKTRYNIVWEEPPAGEAPFDNRFYWGRQSDGTLIPRSLTDINEVDGNGDPLLDSDGNQVVTLGLKSVYKARAKEQAGSMIAPTDWHVIKASEVDSYSVPANISQYRADVRTASNTIEAAIDGAADLTAFIALFDAPVDADGNPTGNAPINDWPDAI